MGVQVSGIVTGERAIEVDTPLPYSEGARVSIQVELSAGPEAPIPDARRLLDLSAIGASGLQDVAENKHRYLADAYAAWRTEDAL